MCSGYNSRNSINSLISCWSLSAMYIRFFLWDFESTKIYFFESISWNLISLYDSSTWNVHAWYTSNLPCCSFFFILFFQSLNIGILRISSKISKLDWSARSELSMPLVVGGFFGFLLSRTGWFFGLVLFSFLCSPG